VLAKAGTIQAFLQMDWGVSYRGMARQNCSTAGIWAGSISNTTQHVTAVLIMLSYKLKDISRAGPRHVDTSGRLIIWLHRQANNSVPLKTSNFFWSRIELVNLSEGSCSNCGQFWKNIFPMETGGYCHHICDYSSDVIYYHHICYYSCDASEPQVVAWLTCHLVQP
jgi:hypothetical protein